MIDQETRSPTRNGSPNPSRSSPGPKAAIRPRISWPRMIGVGSWRRPEIVCRSEPQMVLMRIRHSAAPGSMRSGRSNDSIVSG